MRENKLEWKIILSLKEFNQYFNNSELLINSQLSKHIRNKLRPCIFKNININELMEDSLKYLDLNDSDEQKYSALNFKFNSIKNYVNKVEFNMLTDPLLTPVIVNYFEFISNLTISEFIIPHPIISSIFDSLKYLHSLKLNYCLILFHPNSNSIENLNLPKTIKLIDFTHNAGLSTPEFNNIENFIKLQSSGDSNTSPVNLKFSNNLPNLKKLRFIKGNDQDHETLKSIIMNNSDKLEIIDIYIDQLTHDIYNCLASCNNLKSVMIRKNSIVFQQLEYSQYPTIPSVKSLNLRYLSQYDNDDLLNYITLPFINLKNLSLSNMKFWNLRILHIIQLLTKLENLKIYWVRGINNLVNFELISNSLRILEFSGFNDLEFNFNMISLCSIIDRVIIDTKKITTFNKLDYFRKLELSSKSWRVLEFSDTINCYKLN